MKLLRKLKSNIFYSFNKFRFKLFISALKYKPYDYSYMLELLKTMADYNEYFYGSKYSFAADSGITKREMRWIKYCVDVINDNINMFEMDISDFTAPEYKCNIYVNTKNVKRFAKKYNGEHLYYKKYPDELYKIKAKNILSKLIQYKLFYWWD